MVKRLAWVCLLLILPFLLAWDFSRFMRDYHRFHEQALAGVEQLTRPATAAEVIVVLTGDTGRIPRALELLRVRGSSRLIVSGAAKGVSLAALVSQQGASLAGLRQTGKTITLESRSSSTVENAQRTLEVLKGAAPSTLILVTSDYHMQRSMLVFRSVFPHWEILPFSVASSFSGRHGFHFFWKTGAEYWKSLVYRLSIGRGAW